MERGILFLIHVPYRHFSRFWAFEMSHFTKGISNLIWPLTARLEALSTYK